MWAVIEWGGKQYRVFENQRLRIEKNRSESKGVLVFDKVLLESDGKETKIGHPYLEGAKVEARVLKAGREKKKIVFRYHSKTRYRRKKTHRQPYWEVEISKVA